MFKLILRNSVATILVLLLTVFATNCSCSSSNNNNQQPNPPKEIRGGKLFETDKSATQLQTEKQNFLTTAVLRQAPSGAKKFQIDVERKELNRPNTPVVFRYHLLDYLDVPLAVQLPAAYRFEFPREIRGMISQYDIKSLDIFWVAQYDDQSIRQDLQGNNTGEPSLKPPFWMFPNRPAISTITGAPAAFQKEFLAGIFDSQYPIDDQVVTGKMNKFSVSLHDGLVSPNTGHIDTSAHNDGTGTNEETYSFYSLIIYEEENRAAVTLHWLMPRIDVDWLEATAQARLGQTLDHLLQDIYNDAGSAGRAALTINLKNKLHELMDP